MMDPFAPLRPIMARCQTGLSERDFQSAVNVTFHKYESQEYDSAHQDMWQSLPRQFSLLAGDVLNAAGAALPASLRLLDIGCGTGLATTSLLKTTLGSRVSHITLLDTSAQMLSRAKERSQQWGRSTECREGLLEDLPPEVRFDLAITSSVLHHVPDLKSFFDALAIRQPSGSFFVHIQDPNGDAFNDPDLERRRASIQSESGSSWLGRLNPSRVLGRIRRELQGTQGKDYVNLAIHDLVRQGATPLPLTISEIYRITDIHVNNGKGISISDLETHNRDSYQLVRRRSYGFYGVLESELPPAAQAEEIALSGKGALNGVYLAAVWRRQ